MPRIIRRYLDPTGHASFVRSVILKTDAVRPTLCGRNTQLFSRTIVERYKEDSVKTLRAVAKWASANEKGLLAKQCTAMAHWLEERSAENVLWVLSLMDVIRRATQFAVFQFMEEKDDDEFENIEILGIRPRFTGGASRTVLLLHSFGILACDPFAKESNDRPQQTAAADD